MATISMKDNLQVWESEREDPGGISPIARPSSLSINPASGS